MLRCCYVMALTQMHWIRWATGPERLAIHGYKWMDDALLEMHGKCAPIELRRHAVAPLRLAALLRLDCVPLVLVEDEGDWQSQCDLN